MNLIRTDCDFLLTAENAEMTEKEKFDNITGTIISRAIEVHRALGPGLLESAYESCLAFELVEQGLKIYRQKPSLVYRDVKLDCGYRLDILVEESVIIEIKVTDNLALIHKAQLLSYLKLSGCTVGLLINFNVQDPADGVIRIVNNFHDFPRSLRTLQ